VSRLVSRRWFLGGAGSLAMGAVLLPDLRTFFARNVGGETPIYQHVPVFGTRMSFAVRHPDARLVRDAIRAAIRSVFDVHQTMTLFEPSPLTYLNTHGVERDQEVSESLWAVLCASRELHRRTGGLFDATLGRLIPRLQRELAAGQSGLSEAQVASLLATTGWNQVNMDDARHTVRFAHPNTALDFNGIAKGYAVDQAVSVLRRAGLEHFLVNAGGDLYAAGTASPQSRGWPIRLESTIPGAAPLHTFEISDRAVATSGNAAQPRGSDGRVIEHLIHPALGVPTGNYVTATVLARTAMEADAWATAAFVGEPSFLVQNLSPTDGPEIYLVDRQGQIRTLVA
jgi:thiamine biosynthesis lipoprotein